MNHQHEGRGSEMAPRMGRVEKGCVRGGGREGVRYESFVVARVMKFEIAVAIEFGWS